ncbi:ubiquitin carboxyl-terminal hydrolase-like protein, partial [Euroglyphus maynei]
MSFLLDAIHEDLNRNETKIDGDLQNDNDDNENDSLLDYDLKDCPSKEIREEIFTRITEIAERAWKQYRLRNNSIIIDLFCGQFKSILTCPDCLKKSIIFDPFLFVPLPIPPPKLIYNVIYFDRDHQTDMCKSVSKFSIRIAQNSTVNDLLDKLYREKQVIPTKNVRLMQPQFRNHTRDLIPVKFFNVNWLLTDCQQPQQLNNSIFTNNNDNHSSFNLSNQQPLLLFELPPTTLSPENENSMNNNEHVELCIIQRELRENPDFRSPPVGFPFVCSIKKSRLTYSHLCEVLCSYARFSVIAYRQAMPMENEFSNLNRFNVHSFTPKNVTKSSNNNNNNNNNMETIDPLPHLIYHKCKTQQPYDTIAPFLLMSLSFDKETEITPTIPYKNVDMEQDDDDDYGDVNSSTSTNGEDSSMHEQSVQLRSEEELLEENEQQQQQPQQQ